MFSPFRPFKDTSPQHLIRGMWLRPQPLTLMNEEVPLWKRCARERKKDKLMGTTFQDREMSDTEDSEQRRAAEDEEVQIIDLEQDDPLAESKRFQLTSALLRWQGSLQRRSWCLLCTAISLLLLVVLLIVSNASPSAIIEHFRSAYAPQARPTPSGSILAVLPRRDGISCLRDAIWSPDSKFIAVLGYSQTCSYVYVAYVPGLVNLYDAQTGKLIGPLHPDDAIVHALKAASASPGEPISSVSQQKEGAGSLPVISYTHVVWSPDTQRLAFTFHLLAPSPSMEGVVLMNRDGGHPQVLLQHQKPDAPSYTEWDGERSTPIISKTFALPPALVYQWSPTGTLIPERLLPTGTLPVTPPSGAIGNPDGGSWFTLWQPAVTQVTSASPEEGHSKHRWSTSFAAWSPDGRFLIPDLSFWGELDSAESSTVGNQFVTVISLDQAARVPRHETASGQVIATTRDISDKGVDGLSNPCVGLLAAVDTPLTFAWSPNGRVLADYDAGNGVDLYDCTTGHKLTSFTLRSKYAAPSAFSVVLRWSPDGSHLLLSSVALGLVSLWAFGLPQ